MKKKVIKIVVDTELTNEQIERADSIELIVEVPSEHLMKRGIRFICRNVQVLDSDEIGERDDG